MKNILIPFLTKKIIPNIGMVAITVFTTATTGVAAYKLSQGISPDKQIIEPVSARQNTKDTDSKQKNGPQLPTETAQNQEPSTHQPSTDISVNNSPMTTDVSESNRDNPEGTLLESIDNNSSSKISIKPSTTNITTNSNGTATFTLEMLATHNKPQDCYIAYSGTVYDVSNHSQWENCTHHGITGGQDITLKFPHPTSYLSTLPVVGTLITANDGTPTVNDDDNDDYDEQYEDSGDEVEDNEEQYEDSDEIENSEEEQIEDQNKLEDNTGGENEDNNGDENEDVSQISVFRELAYDYQNQMKG